MASVSWDDYADVWDENGDVRAYSHAAFESLTRVCADRSFRLTGARALDFGCGTGLLTEKLAPLCAVIVALDTSERMIAHLRDKVDSLGLTNILTTTEDIQHAIRHNDHLFGSPFDLVVCSSVCAFLDDYAETARTLVRLLRPGGLFVQWDWELDPDSREPFGLGREQMEEAQSAAGLETIQVATAFELSMGEEIARPLIGVGQVPAGEGAFDPL